MFDFLMSQVIATAVCVRILRMPRWREENNEFHSYFRSIRYVEYLILSFVIVSVTPNIIKHVAHALITNTRMSRVCYILLMAMGQFFQIGGILQPILFLGTHKNVCTTILRVCYQTCRAQKVHIEIRVDIAPSPRSNEIPQSSSSR